MSGTIFVHDGRPGWRADECDEQGLGPVLMTCRARRQLHVGDTVELPGGGTWSVQRSRSWRSGRRWQQAVLIGETMPVATAPLSAAPESLTSAEAAKPAELLAAS